MKLEEGRVLSVEGNTARVKVGRHEDCSGCGACPSAKSLTIDAENTLGAAVGQRVRFVMKEESLLLAAFVVFILPIILAAFGGLLGFYLGFFYGFPKEEVIAVGAMIFFFFGLLIVKFYDKKVAKDKGTKPVIVEILRSGSTLCQN